MHLFIHYQKCPEIFRHTQSLVTSLSICKILSKAFQLRTSERLSLEIVLYFKDSFWIEIEQVAFQSNANHPLAESMGYIKFEGM